MDKKTPLPTSALIENAADYVDSLSRPQPNEHPKWKFIAGRRMRDKFLPSVIVPDESPSKVNG